MTISKRQQLLIERLREKNMLTANSLAQFLGVSSKTVRNDICQINQEYKEKVIRSKAGKGYFVSDNFLITKTNTNKIKNESLVFEVLKCIVDNEENDFFELADRFYISESTLTRILNEINTVIADKNEYFCIIRKKNNLLIEAKEEEKRQIFNLFLSKEVETYRLDLKKYADYFDFCDLNDLSDLILDYHKKINYYTNDFATVSFILHIAILLDRTSNGSYIKHLKKDVSDDKSNELAKKLAFLLENEFSIQIPKEEIDYISQLYSKKITPIVINNHDNFESVVDDLLVYIKLSFGIDFSKDQKMRTYLLNHLTLLYQRANSKQFLSNPLTEELKNKFPFIYNVSVFASAWIQNRLKIVFPDAEIAYIALHFLSASETINHGKQRTILLVSPYGVGSQRLVSNQLKKILDYSIKIIFAPSVFDLQEVIESSKIDLILTAEHLEFSTSIPIYQYYLSLTNEDLTKIKYLLDSSSKNSSIAKRFFKKELFFPGENFSTSDEVIHFLCKKLISHDFCSENYTEKVLSREKLSGTSYGNYYAIPHAIQRCAKKNAIAVCSLKKPINWNGKRVKLVLLLALTEERDSSFELLFEQLVSILSDQNVVNQLSKEKNFFEFLSICESNSAVIV